MLFKKYCLAKLFTILFVNEVLSVDNKVSLTFVIDDTYSMDKEIEQVKARTNEVFDAVLDTNSSLIENFVLVTFNDPTAMLWADTTDRIEFKAKLDDIVTDGGDDCPEMAMEGILLAVENSRPNSLFYVMTDASAKDYLMYDEVIRRALKKFIQVTFLLTGSCSDEEDPDYQVYHKIAKATGGEVFNLEKEEIKKILDYILEMIADKKVTLRNQNFPLDNPENEITFSVDSKVNKVTLSLVGPYPSFIVQDDEGNKVPTTPIVTTNRISILKMEPVIPGNYKAVILSTNSENLHIKGSSDISFNYKFSTLPPTTKLDTVTRPIAGAETYLMIEFSNDEDDMKLETANLLDIQHNPIQDLALHIVNEKEKLYVTDKFVSPHEMFTIAINGVVIATNEIITRLSTTAVLPLDPTTEIQNEFQPIIEEIRIDDIESDEMDVKCKVLGSPEPEIVWTDNSGLSVNGKMSLVEVSNYISVLRINKKDDNTFTCTATNTLGSDVKTIAYNAPWQVPLIDKNKSKVFATQGDSLDIICRVLQGNPKPTFKWSFKPRDTGTFLDRSETGNSVHFDKLELVDDGTYACEARNLEGHDYWVLDVFVEYPPFFTSAVADKINSPEGTVVTLYCPVKGIPAPSIQWYFEGVEIKAGGKYELLADNNLSFSGTIQDTGVYKCEASNNLGGTSNEIQVNIHARSTAKLIPPNTKIFTLDTGRETTLDCETEGLPVPDIKWHYTGFDGCCQKDLLPDTGKHSLTLKSVEVSDAGYYICSAHIGDKWDSINYEVHVEDIPKEFQPTVEEIKVDDISSGDKVIRCTVKGNPEPNVIWTDKNGLSLNGKKSPKAVFTYISELKINKKDDNTYTCTASNKLGSHFKTVAYNAPLEAPLIDKSETRVFAKRGYSLDIFCRILQSNPKPTFKWSFKPRDTGTFLDRSETANSINFDKLELGDDGTYACEARNLEGHDYWVLDVFVEYPPFFTSAVADKINSPEGTVVTLYCPVKGIPAPSIQWYFEGVEIKAGGKYELLADNNLSFSGTIQDTGVYKCEASNNLGGTSNEIQVNIHARSTAKLIPPNTKIFTLDTGRETTLDCETEGLPVPDIKWHYTGFDGCCQKDLLPDTGKQSLTLKSVEVSDAGYYICSAHIGDKWDSINYEVHVEDIPKEFQPTVEEIKVDDISSGDKVIRCTVKGNPEPNVIWTDKNGLPLNGKKSPVEVFTYISELKINKRDDNTYTCTASNKLGSRFKTVAYDAPLEAPLIDKSQTRVFAKRGNSLDISCRIKKGNPSPTLKWYFKPRDAGTFLHRSGTEKLVHIDKLGLSDDGTYACEARNSEGRDYWTIDVFVEHPPFFTSVVEDKVNSLDGTIVTLNCPVKGTPAPSVRWYRNGVEITSGGKYKLFTDYSLSFISTILDTGDYKCEASNKFDTTSTEIHVNILATSTAKLIPPNTRVFTLEIGHTETLDCKTEGLPVPDIKWHYTGFDGCCKKDLVPDNGKQSLTLDQVKVTDAGYYVCSAHIGGKWDSINYEVHVIGLPWIENKLISKELTAVDGDLVLTIPCQAFGYPTPAIIWLRESYPLSLGNNVYVDNGVLIIKDVSKSLAGSYTCVASNKYGKASETFEVNVLPSPKPDSITMEMSIMKDKMTTIPCDLPHSPVDKLRWYKNGVLRRDQDLILYGEVSSEGTYTCRVSSLKGSKNYHIKIFINSPPSFTSDEVVWYWDAYKLKETQMYLLADKIGSYTCELENGFGYISRKFTIVAPNCTLNIATDFAKPEPLLLTSARLIPRFEVVKSVVHIPRDTTIFVSCQSSYIEYDNINLKTDSLELTCKKETNFVFKHSSKLQIDFRHLKCKEPVRASSKNSGILCSLQTKRNKLFRIGYKIRSQFLYVYELCYDLDTRTPIYTILLVHKSGVGIKPDRVEYENTKSTFIDMQSLYECDRQKWTISKRLGRDFHATDSGCFEKRQMNWEEIENRVHNKVKTLNNGIVEWTGVFQQLQLPTVFGIRVNINLSDKHGRQMSIPKYWWKVVRNEELQAGVVIVQVNVPDISSQREAESYVLCKDICHEVPWLKNDDWKDFRKGYVFCCSINDFHETTKEYYFRNKIRRVLL
ncbi:unnamed protein product [Leptosia nina]|uniref:Ig-like domain-containing protein n=1 Tax=Leptosia nina TaxID=320188 RepID=A0AAV1J250_9NEOP